MKGAIANLGSLAARYRLDLFPDWESRVAQKFGGYEDNEEYVRLCVIEAMKSCRLSATLTEAARPNPEAGE